MATIEKTTTGLKGLSQFLPAVPQTAPLAPPRAANGNTQRRGRRAVASTPTLVPAEVAAPRATETEETRRSKTVRMGQARMVNALRSIRLLGNLSSRNYEWRDGEVERMQEVLAEALTDTFGKFKKDRAKHKLEDSYQLSVD